jgi:CheY-like chemotaxis protein
MDPATRARIFDPFFTTKPKGKGTGMGLAMVHGIVTRHGGAVYVYSEPGRGSTFTLFFPRIPETDLKTADVTAPLPLGRETILYVDDEGPVLDVAQEMLASLGYTVVAVQGSVRAFDLVGADPGRFDLVITDQNMPEMTGTDLARKILALRPGMRVILCTGFGGLLTREALDRAGVAGFLQKPFSKETLGRKVRAVLDSSGDRRADSTAGHPCQPEGFGPGAGAETIPAIQEKEEKTCRSV